ncbi:MAG: corrinoid protein [Desulfobacteraceae bacterium]|nr:corrinoid protein [Desulfobacteraceae bacterium]
MNILTEMSQTVIDGNREKAVQMANKAIESGIDPLEAMDAYMKGISFVGKKFASGEYFLPELIISGEAMKKAVDVLDVELQKKGGNRKKLGKVVMGTVEGDVHDIGKTIVSSLLGANGFEVFDLGTDVKVDEFVSKVKEEEANIVGLSALLATTLFNQARVIESLKEAGLLDHVAVMIGGAPASQSWCDEIEADGYGENAIEATSLAKNLMTNLNKE